MAARKRSAPLAREPVPVEDYDRLSPLFSFEYLDHEFCLEQCDKDQKSDLAEAIVKRANIMWRDLQIAGRHKLGTERIDVEQTAISERIPPRFTDGRLIVFRYSGNLPMVGFRHQRIFYVLAIEAHFGDLYVHG